SAPRGARRQGRTRVELDPSQRSPSDQSMRPSVLPPALKHIVEALLFAAQKSLTAREIKELLVQAAQDAMAPEAAPFRKIREAEIQNALSELESDHRAADRSYRLTCVAEAWQFTT